MGEGEGRKDGQVAVVEAAAALGVAVAAAAQSESVRVIQVPSNPSPGRHEPTREPPMQRQCRRPLCPLDLVFKLHCSNSPAPRAARSPPLRLAGHGAVNLGFQVGFAAVL